MNDPIGLEIALFSKAFQYRRDTWPSWRILDEKPYTGDCEDYALTVAWIDAGRSRWRLLWQFLMFEVVFWSTLSDGNRRPHAVLWKRGRGWIDNIYPSWSPTCRHTRLFPINAGLYLILFSVGLIAFTPNF